MRALVFILLSFAFVKSYGQNYSDSLSHHERYEGRVGVSEDKFPVFYWAGSSATIKFTGTELGVTLNDEKGENFFQVIVDGHEEFPILIDCEQGEKYYQLAYGLPKGEHIAYMVKRTEPWEGSTTFKGFKVNGEILPLPKSDKEIKIEFYGNSITSGMGNEDLSDYGRQNGNPRYKNHYLSYASIASRYLNAEHRSISLSGIGILVSWDAFIMPEIYNRTNPFDEKSKWDFSQWTPDIVVINLFQNDSWLVEKPDHEQFKLRFPNGKKPSDKEIVKAHMDFVKSIRKEYPNAKIICALGSMDATREGSQWPGYVEQSVDKLKQKGDDKLYVMFFPHNGHPAHPTVYHHFEMAKQLEQFIRVEVMK